MNKIEKIENLNNIEFQDLLCKVIESVGYNNVESIEDNIIKAKNVSPLSSEEYLFLIFPFKLSGIADVTPIKEILIEKQKKHSSNSIHVVSKYHISNGFEDSIKEKNMPFKINFIGRDRMIKLINEHYSEFWRHNDSLLIEYERQFCNDVNQETELKK